MTERFICVCSRFIATSVFVDGYAYSRSFGGFFDVVTVDIFFVSEHNDAVNSFEWLSLAWKFTSLSSGSSRFLFYTFQKVV